MKIHDVLRFCGIGATALLVAACGSGSDVSVKVGSLPSALATRGRSAPTDAVASSTAWSFAKVDGVKLTLTRLQTVNGSNENDVITWSGGKEIIVAPGQDNTIAITETASISTGTYRGAKLRYNNSYSIKAFCRTSTKFVYTTATGVKAIATPGTMPTDYDYFSYPFAEVTTATSATGGNPETMAQTDTSFTIGEGGSVSMAVLVDPSYLVTCYDGTQASADATGALSPFVWTNNNGVAKSAFFPNTSPNFGMGYVPIFISVSTDASAALPTAETYASSLTSTDLNAPIDFRNVGVTTFVFKSDGSILGSRTRIGAAGGGGALYQFSDGFTLSGSNHEFYNGEWNCEAGYTNCGVIKDRKVTNFTRLTDFTTTHTSSIGDGPDCGKTIYFPGKETEWGNRARACDTTRDLFWKKITR